MKTSVAIIVTVLYFGNLFAQNEPSDYFTQIFPSPTGGKVIIVECNRNREVGCDYWIISNRLYNVPFDCNKYVELPDLYHINWDSYGTKIFNTRSFGNFTDGDTYVNSNIEIYDTNGLIFDTITFASSPISKYGVLFFCREYDKEKNIYYPQIFKYDLKTKEETLIHSFDTIYTFWNEQYDCIDFPKIKFNSTYPHGIVCVLYNKNNQELQHTAVVDPSIKNVVLWKEGYHFDCMTNE